MASGENESRQVRKTNHRNVTRKQSKIFSNPFLNFIRDFRKEMQGQNVTTTQLAQLAGQRWREMTPEQRLPYIELAQQARKTSVVTKSGKKTKVLKKSSKKNDKKEKIKERKSRKAKDEVDKNTKKCVYCGSYYKRNHSNDKMITSTSSLTHSYSSVTSGGSGR